MAVVASGVYANSLRNGFVMDDARLTVDNPAVRTMDVPTLLGGPWWPPPSGARRGLYRPLSALGLAVEWRLWGDARWAYHAVNVATHAVVSTLLFFLLLGVAPATGAFAGSLLFALHPVHTEAVASVVGLAELLAAGFVFLACIAYVRWPVGTVLERTGRTVVIGALYFLGLCSKEIAVTLPALLVILGWLEGRTPVRSGATPDHPAASFWRRLSGEVLLFACLAGVLGLFVVLRFAALGSVGGVEEAPTLRGLGVGERILTAVSLWPEYGRLLLFPFHLVSDYAPGVLFPARAVTPEVVAGIVLAVCVGGLAVLTRRRVPHVAAGFLWFAAAILPVSQLLLPVGVLLAERTLYLPSAGLGLAVSGLVLPAASASRGLRRATLVGGTILAVGFAARVFTRNPAWRNDQVFFASLARDHPESFRIWWLRAAALARRGDGDAADRAYERAVALNPYHRALLVEAAAFLGRRQEWEKAEPLLRRAIDLAWWHPEPYAHLAYHLLLQKRFAEARQVALEGLGRAGPSRLLWTFVSDSYMAEGRLDAAARAQRAALSADPGSGDDWLLLLEILDRRREQEGGP